MCIFRRTLLFLMILSSILVNSPKRALACACMASPSITTALADATAVFTGRITRLELTNNPFTDGFDTRIKVTIETARVWKGPRYLRLVVYTHQSSASCGYPFNLGEEYLVYAHGEENNLYVGLCSLTKPLNNATADLQALGNGQDVLVEGVNFGIPLMASGLIALIAVVAISVFKKVARSRTG
jgi:hypothetical protein